MVTLCSTSPAGALLGMERCALEKGSLIYMRKKFSSVLFLRFPFKG